MKMQDAIQGYLISITVDGDPEKYDTLYLI